MTYDIMVLERKIRITLLDTGRGINLLIVGGDQGHIGAVAVAIPGMPVQVITCTGHREGDIAREWADDIAALLHVPVVVSAGIHYEHITQSGIQEVLFSLKREKERLLKELVRSE